MCGIYICRPIHIYIYIIDYIYTIFVSQGIPGTPGFSVGFLLTTGRKRLMCLVFKYISKYAGKPDDTWGYFRRQGGSTDRSVAASIVLNVFTL